MKTYFANFEANNGTSFMNPISGTNKNKLIREIRSIAEGNRFAGHDCNWEVWFNTNDGNRILVGRGGIWATGTRHGLRFRDV